MMGDVLFDAKDCPSVSVGSAVVTWSHQERYSCRWACRVSEVSMKYMTRATMHQWTILRHTACHTMAEPIMGASHSQSAFSVEVWVYCLSCSIEEPAMDFHPSLWLVHVKA